MSVQSLRASDLFSRTRAEANNCEQFVRFVHGAAMKLSSVSHQSKWQVDLKTIDDRTFSCWPHKLKLVNQQDYTSHELVTWFEATSVIFVESDDVQELTPLVPVKQRAWFK